MNGFDNPASLSKMNEKHIADIEKFAREDLKDLLPPNAVKKFYYNLFERIPDRFKIVSGHLLLLSQLSTHYSKKDFFKLERQKPPTNSLEDSEDLNDLEKVLIIFSFEEIITIFQD